MVSFRFWTNLYPELVPYPEQPDIDVTQTMQGGGYNVTYMFKLGEEFFTSMGLKVRVPLLADHA